MIKYAAWGFNLSRGEIVRLRSNIDTNNDDTLTAAQRAAITDQDILQLPGAASPLSSTWSGLSSVDILHTSYLRDNTDREAFIKKTIFLLTFVNKDFPPPLIIDEKPSRFGGSGSPL